MAAAEGHRSRLGRVSCDWEQAFIYWAALPAEARSYAAVAMEFGVSIRTVERHGREGGWRQRLSEINARAAVETDARLGEAKVAYLGRLRSLMEATLVGYADKLRRGDIRFSPSDLDRLYRLWRQLDDELSHSASPATSVPAGDSPDRSVDHAVAVVEALAESGALAQLGLQKIEAAPEPDPNSNSATDTDPSSDAVTEVVNEEVSDA